MPWSRRFTAEGDHAFYVQFLMSIMALHWLSAGLAWRVARAHGYDARSLGFRTSARRSLGIAAALLLAAILGVVSREFVAPQEPLVKQTRPAEVRSRRCRHCR